MNTAHGQPVTQDGTGVDVPVAALAAELARRTSVSWLRHDGRSHPLWHAWAEDALCLVGDGDEQPLPDVGDGDRVEVVMRSGHTGGRVLVWVGLVRVVHPSSPRWAATTAALVGVRLNLPDVAAAPEVWAARSRVLRVEPTGERA